MTDHAKRIAELESEIASLKRIAELESELAALRARTPLTWPALPAPMTWPPTVTPTPWWEYPWRITYGTTITCGDTTVYGAVQ